MKLIRRFASSFAKQPRGEQPLSGIKILDLTRVLAGPYATQMLGDLGAEVIKVESPKGDDTRHWGPPFVQQAGHKKQSAYYLCVNRNKRSIQVDFSQPSGQEIIKQLASRSDVVVENYLPNKLASYGLGFEDLVKVNDRLIYASITGYGQDGPAAFKPGYDVVIEGEAGLMFITGHPDAPPAKVGVAITDLTTGLYATQAILASLLHRQNSLIVREPFQAVHLDINLLSCQVASLANVAANYLMGGEEAKRYGTAHHNVVPYQQFPTIDGGILVGAGNNTQFSLLCKLLAIPDVAKDERFLTNADRVQNRVVLLDVLEDLFKRKTTAEWLEILHGQNLPHGPVNNMKGTFDLEQVKHLGLVQQISHPEYGSIKVVKHPIRFRQSVKKLPASEQVSATSIRRPPPTLGQDTDDVLKELGYSEREIEGLKSDGIV
jgi:succinate--hydroxymethylglutarate CoA-transferase